jgi:hypothetical protein
MFEGVRLHEILAWNPVIFRIRMIIRDLYLLATSALKGDRRMPYRGVTYDNGFTERFYYGETPEEEALRMSRINSVAKFPSAHPAWVFK